MSKKISKPTDEQIMILLNIFNESDKLIWNFNLYKQLQEKFTIEEYDITFSSLRLNGLIKQARADRLYVLTEKGRKVKQLGSLKKYNEEVDRIEELKEDVLKSTRVSNYISIGVSIITAFVAVLTFKVLKQSNEFQEFNIERESLNEKLYNDLKSKDSLLDVLSNRVMTLELKDTTKIK
ncbi:hypothetical protein [Galbibacter sp. BG1]